MTNYYWLIRDLCVRGYERYGFLFSNQQGRIEPSRAKRYLSRRFLPPQKFDQTPLNREEEPVLAVANIHRARLSPKSPIFGTNDRG